VCFKASAVQHSVYFLTANLLVKGWNEEQGRTTQGDSNASLFLEGLSFEIPPHTHIQLDLGRKGKGVENGKGSQKEKEKLREGGGNELEW